ncbi:MAG: hypothetical protein H0X13_00340 [Ramlibacter sp.]|nr:hypothetical protein [Ramlibacter sp.]
MSSSTSSPVRGVALALALALATTLLGGCAVITVGSTAVGLAATGAGLVVDAAVGTVKLGGKAVGAAVDAVTPGEQQ